MTRTANIYLETTAEAISFCRGFVVDYFEFASERTRGVGELLAHVEGYHGMSVFAGLPLGVDQRKFVPGANLRVSFREETKPAGFDVQKDAILRFLVSTLLRTDVSAGVMDGDHGRVIVWWTLEGGLVVNSHPDPAGLDYYLLEALPAVLDAAGISFDMRDLGNRPIHSDGVK